MRGQIRIIALLLIHVTAADHCSGGLAQEKGRAMVAEHPPAKSPAVEASLHINGRSAFPKSFCYPVSVRIEHFQIRIRNAAILKPPALGGASTQRYSAHPLIDGRMKT
jgi:hypothetical protein